MKLIPVYDRCAVVAQAQVDDEDFATLSLWRWALHKDGYVTRNSRVGGRQVRVLMHRQILGLVPGDGVETDHRDRNPLNNQRANLRVGSHAENLQNKGSYRGASSPHRGVSLHRKTGKWQANARLNGHLHYLGLHITQQEAADAAAAFRRQNMPFAEPMTGKDPQ